MGILLTHDEAVVYGISVGPERPSVGSVLLKCNCVKPMTKPISSIVDVVIPNTPFSILIRKDTDSVPSHDLTFGHDRFISRLCQGLVLYL